MQFTILPAVFVAAAQLIMAAPVETNFETATQLATSTSTSAGTAAATSTAAIPTWAYFIKNINAVSPSTPTSTTLATSVVAAPTEPALAPRDGVDHSKKLKDYLDYSTKPGDKLPECCKKCMLETSNRGGTFGQTVNVMETTLGDFCNYEIRTATWLRDLVLPCTDNACAADHPGTTDASQKWMANVCPGKYGN
ncbi:hypothetical protein MAPG_07177 [Magnaporthiopsis poae ATCC 64411]|uniref:Uncharacterized protein n=1 Tax=Magnaporthiopsis poae (strain ATCC 64411 / 73-15) TaxID=644358 RepID=A0A0C4E3Z5_MAGP6|nr:hypothetical protein MAPG_07177 [Magnaporthiopsis poae ATCC 64411]